MPRLDPNHIVTVYCEGMSLTEFAKLGKAIERLYRGSTMEAHDGGYAIRRNPDANRRPTQLDEIPDHDPMTCMAHPACVGARVNSR